MGPFLVRRLTDTPWFVQRNMLVLLGAIGEWPGGFSPAAHAHHEDERVRRTALKLMLGRPELREAALVEALGDPAETVLRMGLGAAAESCPPAALPRILVLLQDQDRDPELRALAIRALGTVSASTTRDWLINTALGRKRWFRKRRLAPKSPELLVILPILAERWVTHPDAAAVVRLAAKSTDPDIRAAARAGGGEAV